MIEVVTLAAAAFAASDIDDFALLIALCASRVVRPRDVVLGQFAGIAALYGASVAAALAALALPAAYLPWLGVLPLALGIRELLKSPAPAARAPRASVRGIAGVAAVTVANGGDNVAAYVPLLAGRDAAAVAAFGAVFACLTALWCFAAFRLVSYPAAARPSSGTAAGSAPSCSSASARSCSPGCYGR